MQSQTTIPINTEMKESLSEGLAPLRKKHWLQVVNNTHLEYIKVRHLHRWHKENERKFIRKMVSYGFCRVWPSCLNWPSCQLTAVQTGRTNNHLLSFTSKTLHTHIHPFTMWLDRGRKLEDPKRTQNPRGGFKSYFVPLSVLHSP